MKNNQEAFNLEDNNQQRILDVLKDCNSYQAVAFRKYLKHIDREDITVQESGERFVNGIRLKEGSREIELLDTVMGVVLISITQDMEGGQEVKSDWMTDEEIQITSIALQTKKLQVYPAIEGQSFKMKALMHKGKFVIDTFLFDKISYEDKLTKLYELSDSIEKMVKFHEDFCQMSRDTAEELEQDRSWIDNIRKCYLQEVQISIDINPSNN